MEWVVFLCLSAVALKVSTVAGKKLCCFLFGHQMQSKPAPMYMRDKDGRCIFDPAHINRFSNCQCCGARNPEAVEAGVFDPP